MSSSSFNRLRPLVACSSFTGGGVGADAEVEVGEAGFFSTIKSSNIEKLRFNCFDSFGGSFWEANIRGNPLKNLAIWITFGQKPRGKPWVRPVFLED